MRHGDKIGKWITIDGVRDHYRGLLLDVCEVGGGFAFLRLSPCYWLESLGSPQNERAIQSSVEHPVEIHSIVIGAVAIQPDEWPKH